MGKEMEGHEPVKDYHELTILIETGLEALSAARNLLAGLENLPEVMAAPRLAALLGHQSSATLPRIREVVERDRRRLAIIERLVTLLPKAGRNGASILYQMLDNPGVFVPCKELVRSAGIRTADTKAVKVYVCHLRYGLRILGILIDAIETGRGSYRVTSKAAALILSLIGDDLTFDGRSVNMDYNVLKLGRDRGGAVDA
ncbi:hypothetical protein [Sphingomonas yabuuchiae]|uniref:Uncharacterized protein n=1 Tax=Sphingomonas yabuuchiae TaxID=172044 RepID=A0AA40ZVJ0_9SPHN|nr:hypothetical protein [Sphingomonas yabuuchiae]MBB4611557.1 hypothetical protein [Sphingomonas yabuuchiae]MBN3556671.1 hypothetical protein [Sphingomonas yabuuchiae]